MQATHCTRCDSLFSSKANKPQILKCQHHLCKKCCFDLFQKQKRIVCPLKNCGSPTQVDPIRLEINQRLVQDIETLRQVCVFHNQSNKFYCFDDQRLICQKCIQTNSHPNHKVQEISEVNQSFLNEIPALLTSILQKQNIISRNCQKFQQIRQELILKDQEFKKFVKEQAELTIEFINYKKNLYCHEHQELTEELVNEIDQKAQK